MELIACLAALYPGPVTMLVYLPAHDEMLIIKAQKRDGVSRTKMASTALVQDDLLEWGSAFCVMSLVRNN